METTTNTRKQESGKVSTMKKAVGIIGIFLAIWGLYAIISLFVDYKSSETTDDAQVEQYFRPLTSECRAISRRFTLPSISTCVRETPCSYWKTMNTASV